MIDRSAICRGYWIMPVSYLPVTWQRLHTLCMTLATDIKAHCKPHPDEIIAIGRGGLSVGLIMSDLLRIPISSFTIQSYTDIKTQGELAITQKLGKTIQGRNVLVVDDNADSGKTFVRAVRYLKAFRPAIITTASVFFKPWSSFRPDFFAEETKDWILFPHEMTEWIYTCTQKMKKEGKSDNEIAEFLASLGYTDDQIRFVYDLYDV